MDTGLADLNPLLESLTKQPQKVPSGDNDNTDDDFDEFSPAYLKQQQAAAALANLARDSAGNRVSIVEAGGIRPLLELLENGATMAKENALMAITQLSHKSPERQQAIADADGELQQPTHDHVGEMVPKLKCTVGVLIARDTFSPCGWEMQRCG